MKTDKKLDYSWTLKWRRGLLAKEVSKKYDFVEEWNDGEDAVTFIGITDGVKTLCKIDNEGIITYTKC